MSEFKYIVIRKDDGEHTPQEFPIIFPKYMTHKEVFDAQARAIQWHSRSPCTSCVGAGFVRLGEVELRCYGESESLKVKSRGEEDTRLIDGCEYTQGLTT